MKVKILIEFEVEPSDEDDTIDEAIAKSAASMAAYDFLSFTKVSGYSTDSNEVKVWVDGFGEYLVRIGDDHE